jgi:hypothetical protein
VHPSDRQIIVAASERRLTEDSQRTSRPNRLDPSRPR